MSSNQQYKDYNKRLKSEIRALTKSKDTWIFLANRSEMFRKTLLADNERLKRQLKQSKRWYQIILK